VIAFAVSLSLIYMVPYGFTDKTTEGKKGLGRLAAKITLPSRATLKKIAVDERDGKVHAASWAFTLPEAAPIDASFADELANGIAEMGKKAPATELAVKGKQTLRVQDTDGGRVDVDMTVDGTRMRETIYYAPGDHEVSVMVYLCPLDELSRYHPIIVASVQGREAPSIWERPWPWRRIAEIAAVIAFVAAGWGARAARKRLTRSAAGSTPSRSG
jgi:hypothetical protein